MPASRPIQERFDEKYVTIPETGCWWWTAATTDKGYGQIGYKGKVQAAHRVSYQIHCGEIPTDKHILHSCDNPTCVNPDHLRVGTNADNVRDRVNRGRCGDIGGENSVHALLTKEDVAQIRLMHTQGITQGVIASKYNVGRSNIGCIVRGETWRNS